MPNIFHIYALLFIACFGLLTLSNTRNFTELKPMGATFKNLVLHRRTRSVVFPNKAFLLLTPAFTKAVIDGRPRGVSYSIEFDMYSALPDTIESWQPTILVNKIKKDKQREQLKAEKEAAATPSAATTAPLADASDNVTLPEFSALDDLSGHNFETDYWANTGNHYQYPLDDPPNGREWLPNETYLPWNRRAIIDQSEYLQRLYQRTFKKKFPEPSDNNVYDRFHKKPKLREPPVEKYKYAKSGKKSKKPTYTDKQSKYAYYEKWSSYGPTEVVYNDADAVPKWKVHQGYRERREIFEQLTAVGKIFQIDLKACIQRAMCEVTSHLRPYGDSLMEDILRIILTVPNDRDFDFGSDDDYSYMIQRYRTINCVRYFAVTCPYHVLEILTKHISTIHNENRAV